MTQINIFFGKWVFDFKISNCSFSQVLVRVRSFRFNFPLISSINVGMFFLFSYSVHDCNSFWFEIGENGDCRIFSTVTRDCQFNEGNANIIFSCLKSHFEIIYILLSASEYQINFSPFFNFQILVQPPLPQCLFRTAV